MKNFIKLFGTQSRPLLSVLCAIALAIVIGFSMAACGDGGGGGGSAPGKQQQNGLESTVFESTDGESDYKLEIIQASGRAAYSPKTGDNYVLTINPGNKTSKGTVTVKNSSSFELKPEAPNGSVTPPPFTITFAKTETAALMTGISGTITLTSGETVAAPTDLDPVAVVGDFILYANMWGNGQAWWGDMNLSDFTLRKPKNGEVFKFRISGTTDKPLQWCGFQINCNSRDGNDYIYIGGGDRKSLSGTFDDVFEINIGDNEPKPNYIFYVVLQNLLWNDVWFDSGTRIPEGIPWGTTMATISNFKIALLSE